MRNVVVSILARLKNIAKENGLVYSDILRRYATERILRRIEQSPYSSQCILKGGTLFVLWRTGFDYRPTMDVDFEFRGEASIDGLVRMFREIAALPGRETDGLQIDPKTILAKDIREDDPYGGIRVTMLAHLGNVRLPMQFDVGIGDAVTPRARREAFPVLLGMDIPKILVYPRETVVAEKFETIVKRGMANSRMKDYYDLLVLRDDEGLDRDMAVKALMRTFARRGTKVPIEVPEGLSDGFAEDFSKQIQWASFLRKNRLSVGARTLLDVVRELREFFFGLITVLKSR